MASQENSAKHLKKSLYNSSQTIPKEREREKGKHPNSGYETNFTRKKKNKTMGNITSFVKFMTLSFHHGK